MVDAVITYVDSTDITWQNEYNKFVKRPLSECLNRFRAYGVLDLQIKLIRKFMPFVDKVFVIVSSMSQVPDMVKCMDGVRIVLHKEIIPKMFLPCFNSCTIEMFFQNITSLSEQFLYFNDDIFPVHACKEDDFFSDGKVRVNYRLCTYDEYNATIFQRNVMNSTSLFYKKNEILYNGIKPEHSVLPMLKSACKETFDANNDKILKSLSRTRHSKNINVYAPMIYLFKANKRKMSFLCTKYFYADNVDFEQLSSELDDAMHFLCINDNNLYNDFDRFKIELRAFLECLLEDKTYEASKIEDNKNEELVESIQEAINEGHSDYHQLKVALCAIAKNENLYIREWVEWYKNLGISKIFLYDNNELDGERFEEVINDYIENEFVEVIDRRGITKTVSTDQDGQTLQGLSYKDCYDKYYNEFDWICFFDIDEFLEMSKGYNLYTFLSLFTNNPCDGIHVQWRMYGDNNLLYYDSRGVIERFYNKKNESPSTLIKTILKGKEHYKDNILFCAHGPLKISGRFKQIDIINADFSCATNPYRNKHKLNPNMGAYLNHFYCKSTEEFINRKWKKTSAVTGINMNRNYDIEFLKEQYFKHNKTTDAKLQLFDNLINEKKVFEKIDKNDRIIVNFTTWTKRDMYVPFLLKYFKNQTLYPDEIICWLSEDEYHGVIPESIQYCLDNNLLTKVEFVKGNTYGHKRYETFKYNLNAYNILIDDDLYYPIDYVESLYKTCKEYPDDVICYYSRHEIYKHNGVRSFADVDKDASFSNRYFSGLAAFSPYLFPMESFKYSNLRDKYCQKCDDSWVNGWLFKKNIKVRSIKNWGKSSPLNVIGSTQEDGIYETHNGLKINGIMQASINIANAVTVTNSQNIAKEIWPDFNIDEVTTYNK